MSQRFKSIKGFAGGGLAGYIECSYADLIKVFGEPGECDNYKTSTEWCILDTEMNAKISIYDYKETSLYSRGEPTVAEFRAQPSCRWHIGCATPCDIEELADFIKEHAAQ